MAHLVHVIDLDDVIKEAVEVVEEGDHLHRGADGAHGGEAHDIREEDRHYIVALRFHWFPCHELIRNVAKVKKSSEEVMEWRLITERSLWCQNTCYLGIILERSLSARVFSAVSCLVLSSTTSSKWFAYFSNLSTILSSILAWLQHRTSRSLPQRVSLLL